MTSKVNIDLLKELHGQNKSNRQIAKILGVHHNTIGQNLKRIGLKANYIKPTTLNVVSETTAICSICKEEKLISVFQLNKRNKNNLYGPYKNSYCNTCKNKKIFKAQRKNLSTFLRDRFNRLKLRCAKNKINCNIDENYLKFIFERQNGKCFYSDILINWSSPKNRKDSLSIDRIDSTKGYVKGNVVLTTRRINAMKLDATLDEMKIWMPDWYRRIVDYEPEK